MNQIYPADFLSIFVLCCATAMSLAVAPGTVVASRYLVESKLGEGGMGVVWRARDLKDGIHVALKVLRVGDGTNAELVRRMSREARAARAIPHPAVVRILDVLEIADSPILVMEFLQGETLAERLSREKVIHLRDLTGLIQPMLSALQAAHKLGIIHRDLKPENVFLVPLQLPPPLVAARHMVQPKILDFGVAKLTATEGIAARSNNQSTVQGAVVGTPLFMSPEQLSGDTEIDYRTDIYSLGVMIYLCLSGEFPTTARMLGPLLLQIVTGRHRPLGQVAAHLPRDITTVVMAMLAPIRDFRPSLDEVDRALLPYAPTIA
jgi:serine/threonine-protein kinase